MIREWNKATQLAWKIRDVYHQHTNQIQLIQSYFGLHTGQTRILHTIKMMDGATQKEIADKLNITPSSLAMSIKRMQRANLITKDTDKYDLRRNSVSLTAHGQGVLDDSYLSIVEMDTQMVQGFSETELEQLSSFLDRINENLIKLKALPPDTTTVKASHRKK